MSDKRTRAEMIGKALRKAGLLVAVIGTMATTFSRDGFTLRKTAISIAVGVALFAAGIAVEEWKS